MCLPEGCTKLEKLKIDPPVNGTYSDNETDFKVTVSFNTNKNEPQSVNWTSNQPVYYVYVKGGKIGGNLYYYPNGATGDIKLVTPINKLSPQDISHVSFYYGPKASVPGTEEPVIEAPTVTSINPNSDFVIGGILTTITGTNIDKDAKVYFGGTEVSIESYLSTSSISVKVPAAAAPGVVDIKVVNPDGQGAVLENAFTYKALPPAPIPAPTVTSINPNSDFVIGGILTTITGTNIDKDAKVYFGGTEVSIKSTLAHPASV